MGIRLNNICHVLTNKISCYSTPMVLPGMSDGRCFTSYATSCDFNKKLMTTNNVEPNAYKVYLQNNATKLMQTTLNDQQLIAEVEKNLCVDLRST
jgi:hypothetical protein